MDHKRMQSGNTLLYLSLILLIPLHRCPASPINNTDIDIAKPKKELKTDINVTEPEEQMKSDIDMTKTKDELKTDINITKSKDQMKSDIDMIKPTDQLKTDINMTKSKDKIEPDIDMIKPKDEFKTGTDISNAKDKSKPLLFSANAARFFSASLKMVEELRKQNKISFIKDKQTFENISCQLRPVRPYLSTEIKATVKDVKLLEYRLNIANYTDETNPLLTNLTFMYKGNQWGRISHSHGQTILNLAYNYGILSLMTLSFGVAEREVEVYEKPHGCLSPLDEDEKAQVVLNLLMRDFDADGPLTVLDGQFVCNQVIKVVNGYAKFTDQCCFAQWPDYKVICTVDLDNKYLKILDILIAIVTLVVFLFGPMALTGMFYARTLDAVQYVVKLKEPMYKIMCICNEASYKVTNLKLDSKFTLNLTKCKNFTKAKKLAAMLPSDVVLPIKITEYKIQVNYNKLLPEDKVPVGVLQSIARAVFLCKLNEVHAFQNCCKANALGGFRKSKPVPWLSICNIVGKILLVLFLPFPYYIRLAMYYVSEHPEVVRRNEAVAPLDAEVGFEYQILQYLTPLHPLLISMYAIYYVVGFTVAVLSCFNGKSKFQTIFMDAIYDLIHTSWIRVMEMLVRNILWPFKKLGIFGLVIGPLYWIFVIPYCFIIMVFYCLPLVFFSCRLLTHSLGITSKVDHNSGHELPGELKRPPTGMQLLEVNHPSLNFKKDTGQSKQEARQRVFDCCTNFIIAVICIATLCATMIMSSMVVTFLLQIIVFTIMGIIVNAGKVLKYGTLIFLVVLYSYDCYNNVYEQYLRLNKTLFKEIKDRIKELMEFTSLPSYLQENRGFKSQEASEQGKYEEADNFSQEYSRNWCINDLILFIDNEDTPRIPKKLFEEVCEIRVPGSPGPVYSSLLAATGKFMIIVLFLLFVFIVVLSFGNVYNLSSTNQMLATMAGGFMPMIFRNVLKPKQPEIELGSVSFKGKLEEVMMNFWQTWPMFDFPFTLGEKPEEKCEDDDGEKSGSEHEHDKKSDKFDKEMTEDNIENMLAEMEPLRRVFCEKCMDSWEEKKVDLVIVLPDTGQSQWNQKDCSIH